MIHVTKVFFLSIIEYNIQLEIIGNNQWLKNQ